MRMAMHSQDSGYFKPFDSRLGEQQGKRKMATILASYLKVVRGCWDLLELLTTIRKGDKVLYVGKGNHLW